MTVLEHSS